MNLDIIHLKCSFRLLNIGDRIRILTIEIERSILVYSICNSPIGNYGTDFNSR